jgi:hypothetical protein
MPRSTVLTLLALLALPADPALARELNGDLDYSVQSDNAMATLVVSPRRPELAIRVAGVTVLAPATRGKASEQFAIPIPPGKAVAENATIELGSVAALALLVAPTRNTADFRAVAAADNNECQNCDAVAFGLQISVEYGDGTNRREFVEAYLHYFFK